MGALFDGAVAVGKFLFAELGELGGERGLPVGELGDLAA